MITLNATPVRWRSKKQPKPSNSSAEAEIRADAIVVYFWYGFMQSDGDFSQSLWRKVRKLRGCVAYAKLPP